MQERIFEIFITTKGAKGTGIGLACAKLFHKEGASVTIFGRREEVLQNAAKSIGVNVLPVTGSITNQDDVKRLVQDTLRAFSKVDILVNNSGVFTGAPFHDMEDSQWDETLDVNLRGVFLLTREVIRVMIENNGGNIVNISSILGMVATPGVAAYNTSKGALIQLSRSIAVEYGPQKIRSNCVSPGLIATGLTAELMEDQELMNEWSKRYPIGRFGVPEDIANTCLFLASDEASFITGANLPVDGGYTAL